ncbi:MAG TPA: hypothetical protein VI565_06565 [Burkholderiales bacterium]|nr:hypothetical protein [Burkholderiales bacterium]
MATKTEAKPRTRKPRSAPLAASQLETMLTDALARTKSTRGGNKSADKAHRVELRAMKKAHRVELKETKRAYARLAGSVKKLLRRLHLDGTAPNSGNETAAQSSN